MDAPNLILELRSKGYSIRADGDYLDISPADLPPDVVQSIRQSKAEILAALQSEFSQPEDDMSLGLPMSGVGEGWREWQFFGWPKYIKKAVIVLLSRIQEAAFRRGLQQGYLFATKGTKLKIHPDKMRWDTCSLDDARMCCDGTRFSSKQRLHCEHGHTLLMLGLLDSDDQQFH